MVSGTSMTALPVPRAPLQPLNPAISWVGVWIVLLVVAALLNAGIVFLNGGARGFFIPALAAVICALAAIFDAFTRRIPNQLTYAAVLAGLALNALEPLLNHFHAAAALTWLGAVGSKESFFGFLLCAGLALVANLFAGIHGGDLKLLAAVGALLGLSLTGSATLIALVIALIYAVINLALFGRLNKVMQIGSQRALELFFLRRFETPAPNEPASMISQIPMAIPMALGIATVFYLQARHGNGGIW